MHQIPGVSVILPSLNPSKSILTVIKDVLSHGFSDIIVVNDGSCKDFLHLFEAVAEIEGCTVLNHDKNRGKGAALKTGIKYFLENRSRDNGFTGIVTIDDDGQHLAYDIALCAKAMIHSSKLVLGVRDFEGSDVPHKSRFGNRIMRMLFTAGLGLIISDTQTGLRAIPRQYLTNFLEVHGERFEYETNMLLAAKKQGVSILQVPIKTVYIEGNRATHFRALTDSLVIMLQFVKYSAGSLLSCSIDLLGFFALLNILSGDFALYHPAVVFLSTLIARVVSSIFNFLFNKNIVFGYRGKSVRKAAAKYFVLCIFSLIMSSGFVTLISLIPVVDTAFLITAAKVLVDTFLFVMNYYIQKRWVYR
jgi:glycosyltransferase involved in cell wall biosynthesis